MKRWVVVVVVLGLVGGFALWRLGDEPAGDGGEVLQHDAVADDVALPTLRGQAEGTDALPEAAESPGPANDEGPVEGVPTRLLVCVETDGDKKPIEGAVVTIQREGRDDQVQETPPSGELTFTYQGAVAIEVRAAADGYVPSDGSQLNLVAGQEKTWHIQLEAGVEAFGRVSSAEDGRPVVGAKVTATEGGSHAGILSSSSRDPFGTVTTDEDGRFRFPGLPPVEVCTFTASARGFRSTAQSFFPRDARAKEKAVELRLEPGGRVVGRVFDPDGRPVAGATVCLDMEEGFSAVTDANGAYAIEGLTFDRRYDAEAYAKGLATSVEIEDVFTTPNRPEVGLDLTLRKLSHLELRLVDESGSPVEAEGEVVLGAWPIAGWQASPEADVPGGWDFGDVDPGKHALQVQLEGFLRLVRRIEIPEGRTTEVTLALKRGAAIEGVIVDDQGDPVVAATVVAEPKGRGGFGSVQVESDAAGRFRLAGLRTKPHEMRVYARGYHLVRKLEDLTPPVEGLRIEMDRVATAVFRLRMPAGRQPPSQIVLTVSKGSGRGGGGSGETWKDEAWEWAIPPGRRTIGAEGVGFAVWEQEVDLEPGERLDLGVIALEEGASLGVKVKDPEGNPLVGARVVMGSVHETWRAFAPPLTDARGEATAPHLNPGTHEVIALADGFLDTRKNVEVGAGGGSVALTLRRGGLLRVKVLAKDGAPADGADVYVLRIDPPPDHPGPWGASTDELGIMDTREEPGTYRVWVGTREKPTQAKEVVLDEGSTKEVVFRLGGA